MSFTLRPYSESQRAPGTNKKKRLGEFSCAVEEIRDFVRLLIFVRRGALTIE